MRSPEPADAGRGARPARFRQWLREPLVHFLLAGVVLFVLYRVLNPVPVEPRASNEISVTEDDLRQIAATWLAQGRAAPTPEEMRHLVEARVREEIFYREALALGLDKNDTIVKRRLAQKMEFLAEDLSTIGDPGRDQLQVWFDANARRFASAARVSFRHLYFSPDRRGARARADGARRLEKLRGQAVASPVAAGLADAFMFQDAFEDSSLDQVARIFGRGFAQSLLELEPGAWQGPVESGYGWHLVWIEAIQPGRIPAFEEVESQVKRDWFAERRAEGRRTLYEALRARYQITLPEIPAAEARARGRQP